TFRKSAANPAGWHGLRFLDSSAPYDGATQTGSVIQFASIRDTGAAGTPVSLVGASPLLSDLDITSFSAVGAAVSGTANPLLPLQFVNSLVHANAGPMLGAVKLAGNVVVEHDELFGTSGAACVADVTGGTFRFNYIHDNVSASVAVCPRDG